MITVLSVALTGLAALAAGSVVVYALRVGITPTPSSRLARAATLSLLAPRPGDLVLELGCGWGGLAITVARRFPSARIRAYELSPLPWLVAWSRARLGRVRNLEVRRRDFLRESLVEADVVVCYLFTGAMVRLAEKLPGELSPGTPVISLVFAVPGWSATREETLPDVWRSRVRLYRSPAAPE